MRTIRVKPIEQKSSDIIQLQENKTILSVQYLQLSEAAEFWWDGAVELIQAEAPMWTARDERASSD